MEDITRKINNIKMEIEEKQNEINKLKEKLKNVECNLCEYINNDKNFDHTEKILFLGSGGSGKNTLLTLLCENRFEKKYIATLGVDVISFVYNNIKYNVNCVAGVPQNNNFGNVYYLGATKAFIFVDISCPDGLKKLKYWYKDVTTTCSNIKIGIIINKIDLEHNTNIESIERYCNNHKLKFKKISCKVNFDIDEMCEFICEL
jgi:small GTP-binding protein